MLLSLGDFPPVYSKIRLCWSSCCGSAEMNSTSIHEDEGSIPGLTHKDEGSIPGLTHKDGFNPWPYSVGQGIPRCCGCGVGWQLQL